MATLEELKDMPREQAVRQIMADEGVGELQAEVMYDALVLGGDVVEQ